jgi:deoxyribose-phosphate aldolase
MSSSAAPPAVSTEVLLERVQGRLREQGLTLPTPPRDVARGLTWAVPTPVGPPAPGTLGTPRALAPFIDHTLLKPDARASEVVALAREARAHGFATVCVNSSHVEVAAAELAGSPVVPIAVVGFPLGAALPAAKAFEAREAVRLGAREIDTVVPLGALKAGEWARVRDDVAAVVEAAHPYPVKVILETALLDDELKVAGCLLAQAAGAAYVKTSTGFGGGGATAADVALMRRAVGPHMGVKASGGVRSADDALAMLRAGASRLGTSASVAIVTGTLSTAAY